MERFLNILSGRKMVEFSSPSREPLHYISMRVGLHGDLVIRTDNTSNQGVYYIESCSSDPSMFCWLREVAGDDLTFGSRSRTRVS